MDALCGDVPSPPVGSKRKRCSPREDSRKHLVGESRQSDSTDIGNRQIDGYIVNRTICEFSSEPRTDERTVQVCKHEKG